MKKAKKNNNFSPALLARFLKGSTHFFVLSVIFSMLSSLFELVIPQIISFAVDNVLGGTDTSDIAVLSKLLENVSDMSTSLWIIAGMILVFAVLLAVFQYVYQVMNRKGSETLVETMRNTLFSHIERLPSSWFSENQTGDIIQRCTSDIETIKNFLADQLIQVISTVLLIVISLVFMFSINTTVAVIALCSIPIITSYSAIFHGKVGDSFERCDEAEGKLSAVAQENLTGVRVVRAFGREKYEVDKFAKQNENYAKENIRLSRILTMFWGTSDVLSGLQVMIVLVVGTVLCVKGELTVGEFIAVVSYNSMLSWPIKRLGRVISEMSKANVSFGRIAEITDAKEECDAPNSVDCDTSGDIVFDHVSFAYKNPDGSDTKVLDDVSLNIKKGSTLGILGMTGSGKSTLVHLLCRLYELPEGCGTITISGQDIKNIKSSSLRKNIGIVLQEPFLFSRTIRENIGIAFDDPAKHEEDIREGARIACLDETIESFTNGYDTMVGERGVTLSGGQKQRCAIARLITQNSPVMIFDDSLSAVDSETDAKIRKALREKTENATVIIISHRIQTLMSADSIAVMADGKVVEYGSHDTLIAKDGIYKKINDIQSSDSSDKQEPAGKEANV